MYGISGRTQAADRGLHARATGTRRWRSPTTAARTRRRPRGPCSSRWGSPWPPGAATSRPSRRLPGAARALAPRGHDRRRRWRCRHRAAARSATERPRPWRLYDDICAVLVPLWSREFGARLRLATLALAALADEAPRTADRRARRGPRHAPRGWSPTREGVLDEPRARTSDRSRSRAGPGRPGCAPSSSGSSGCSAARSTWTTWSTRWRRDRRAVRRAGAPARGGPGPHPAGRGAARLRRAGRGHAAGRSRP